MKGIKQTEKAKKKGERTAGRNKNHDGLTTSAHSHCSMSSMTEDWPPTPYRAPSRPPQVARRGEGGHNTTTEKKKPHPKHNIK